MKFKSKEEIRLFFNSLENRLIKQELKELKTLIKEPVEKKEDLEVYRSQFLEIKNLTPEKLSKVVAPEKREIEYYILYLLNIIASYTKEKIQHIKDYNEEDKFTDWIIILLRAIVQNWHWHVGGQERMGGTDLGESREIHEKGGIGNADISLRGSNDQLITIFEALLLRKHKGEFKRLIKKEIEEHFNKLFKYNDSLNFYYILYYSKTSDFFTLWKRYVNNIVNENYNFKYKLKDGNSINEELNTQIGCKKNIRILETTYIIPEESNAEVKIYHVFINFWTSKKKVKN